MSAKIGVVSNAHSNRNRTGLKEFAALLHDHPQVKHLAFHDISDLTDCLREMAAAGVTHLCISGGDGTVQAAISALINDKPFAAMPKLSLLSAGMTNVIARDLGETELPAPHLKRLIERVEAGDPGQTVERNVMTLDLFDGGPPIHGFLLGAIAFYQGTILGRRKVHGMGFTQSLASKIGILLSVLRVLWYGPGDRSGFHGERVALSLDGKAEPPQDLFLLVATTLTGILPGIKPFWGLGPGPIRLTTISHPPRRFAFAALPALRGKPKPWMESHGYCSRRADQLECDLVTPVVFDGEFLETDGGPGFRLSVGPKITFTRY
ncbi:diacylglycerol/lipid kinase family protein [Dongia sp.]|uniref:diacylglycerol/lipid kinase family protein n=1 Tax=Dongia sp. TaxID=1977262 RepID=UPI0037527BC7